MIRTYTLLGEEVKRAEGIDAVRPPREGERTWFEVQEPTRAELAALGERLPVHPLSLDDAMRVGHPPKLEAFEDHLFLIAHTPDLDEGEGTRKLSVFFAKHWIVTLLRAPLPSLDKTLDRLRGAPQRYLRSPDLLVHALLDPMLDGFLALAEDIIDRAEHLEEACAEGRQDGPLESALDLRREVSSLTRILRGQRDTQHALLRVENGYLAQNSLPYYRDLYDHAVRIQDQLEAAREALTSAREAHLNVVNTRLNEVMRTLTIIATVMMPLSLLAGIYGMNFAVMPGVESPLGFWILLAAMLLITGGMFLWFRRRGWI